MAYGSVGCVWTRDGGGINSKRLAASAIIENPLVLCKREILGLLGKGNRDAALDLLINCCATEEQKECFLVKHFI